MLSDWREGRGEGRTCLMIEWKAGDGQRAIANAAEDEAGTQTDRQTGEKGNMIMDGLRHLYCRRLRENCKWRKKSMGIAVFTHILAHSLTD